MQHTGGAEGAKTLGAEILSSFSFASVDPSIPDVFRSQPLPAGSTRRLCCVLPRIYQRSENGPFPVH